MHVPHCAAPAAMKAVVTGSSGGTPADVITDAPSKRTTGRRHDRTPVPSMSTVHAPHTPTPHGARTLRIARSWARTARRDRSGVASTMTGRPSTVKLTSTRSSPVVATAVRPVGATGRAVVVEAGGAAVSRAAAVS
jgi:hypothetical protein